MTARELMIGDKGIIDEQKAVEFGQRLRQLVIDMTGYDPHELTKGNTR